MNHRNKIIRDRLLSILLCVAFVLAPLTRPLPVLAEEEQSSNELKITVISDAHLYANSLGITGSEFELYIEKNRKMIVESELILDAALAKIKADNSDILLITGDLTKDGEKVNHILMAQKLKEVEATGKKVYVLNGNHDISNPRAFQYSEDEKKRTPTVSTKDFRKIYKDFGYGEAIAQDKTSLSYVVEPIPGYQIIAIDASKYNDNKSSPASEASGELKDSTLVWVKEQVKAARAGGKVIIGMMHHGVVPHFSMEPSLYPVYLVKDYKRIAQELADVGLSVIFTGHFHAQDIAEVTSPSGNKIYDVETGSLVTYPVPMRNVTMKDQVLVLTSSKVEQVSGIDLKGYANFDAYALDFLKVSLKQQIERILAKALKQQGMKASAASAKALSIAKSKIAGYGTVEEYLIHCMVKHFMGDETPDEVTTKINPLLLSSTNLNEQLIGKIALSFFTDSGGNRYNPISDNTAVITISPAINQTTNFRTLYYGGNTGKTASIKISVPKGKLYSASYKSSKNAVATVSSKGKITATKKGTTTITTTLKMYGMTKVYRTSITVKKASIIITKSKSVMRLGDQFSFTAKAYGYADKIHWLTARGKILVISKQTGKAVAKTKGTDYVIAKVGKLSTKVKVIVR